MPETRVYLDDNNELVPEDEASQIVLTIDDDQGNITQEKWIRIVKKDSYEAEFLEIIEEADKLTESKVDEDYASPKSLLHIVLTVLTIIAVIVILYLLI